MRKGIDTLRYVSLYRNPFKQILLISVKWKGVDEIQEENTINLKVCEGEGVFGIEV